MKSLWAFITGKDKGKKYPNQQANSLNRTSDYTVVFPFGSYCDLIDGELMLEIEDGVLIPVTVKRPDDAKRGEPHWFHPHTNTRIIARNNGDLDIYTNDNVKGNVNIYAVNAKIVADELVEIDSPLTRIKQNLEVLGSAAFQAITSRGKNISDTHTHSGVQSGSSNSGGVN